jgi:uncharacterized cupredoxin-like copper-binding protein
MTGKHLMFVLLALAGALILAACGGGSATTAAPQARLVSVVAADFSFTPASYNATAGEQLTFNVKNEGTLEHNFVILDPSGGELARLDGIGVGLTKALNFSPTAAGAYTIVCDIAGHREAGLEAAFRVCP